MQGNLLERDVPAADIQAIGNGDLTVNASVTNGVGNTGSGSRDITIDANLPGLRVDTVAGDDVVNSIEHSQALVITGSSSGLAAGAALTVVINTVTYAATVLADGTWSLGVPAADVGNWPAGTVNITVSGATSAGNPVTITHPVTVDLAAVAISINTVSGDDVINAAEKGADLTPFRQHLRRGAGANGHRYLWRQNLHRHRSGAMAVDNQCTCCRSRRITRRRRHGTGQRQQY
ncbi:hypothetical protein ECZU29_01560 [Escherichia coli]|nr:hypothetical protein ECZU29_01560 [Escherichia coli]